jgi:hypothetical protein
MADSLPADYNLTFQDILESTSCLSPLLREKYKSTSYSSYLENWKYPSKLIHKASFLMGCWKEIQQIEATVRADAQ